MPRLVDRTGDRHGRLTVLRRAENVGRHVAWLCICDCGNTTAVQGDHLQAGRTRSCGCLHAEEMSARLHKHGMCRTATYNSWMAMNDRCKNPNNANYCYYGALGVVVDQRWATFANFLADMGARPAGMTLDRIDPHGNYEPGNCRWADVMTQARNKRRS